MNYKLLKCYPIAYDTRSDDNHIFIHAVAADEDYSLAVNVRSNISRSRLYYCIKEYDISAGSRSAESGSVDHLRQLLCWGELTDGLCGINALGYARDGWAKAADFLPAETDEDLAGRANTAEPAGKSRVPDLDYNHVASRLVALTQEAMAQPDAFIVGLGRLWGPKQEPDRTFGFLPAQGLHDIHANDDGRDGALFFYYPAESRVVAVFTRFRV